MTDNFDDAPIARKQVVAFLRDLASRIEANEPIGTLFAVLEPNEGGSADADVILNGLSALGFMMVLADILAIGRKRCTELMTDSRASPAIRETAADALMDITLADTIFARWQNPTPREGGNA